MWGESLTASHSYRRRGLWTVRGVLAGKMLLKMQGQEAIIAACTSCAVLLIAGLAYLDVSIAQLQNGGATVNEDLYGKVREILFTVALMALAFESCQAWACWVVIRTCHRVNHSVQEVHAEQVQRLEKIQAMVERLTVQARDGCCCLSDNRLPANDVEIPEVLATCDIHRDDAEPARLTPNEALRILDISSKPPCVVANPIGRQQTKSLEAKLAQSESRRRVAHVATQTPWCAESANDGISRMPQRDVPQASVQAARTVSYSNAGLSRMSQVLDRAVAQERGSKLEELEVRSRKSAHASEIRRTRSWSNKSTLATAPHTHSRSASPFWSPKAASSGVAFYTRLVESFQLSQVIPSSV